MGEMSRKDYGANAIVDQTSETMRRVNSMNAPFSIEATGHDHLKKNLVSITDEASLETLKTGMRVLTGNRQGYIKSIATVSDGEEDPTQIFSSMVVSFPAASGTYTDKDNDGDIDPELPVQDVTYTKAFLLAGIGEAFFIVNP